MIETATYETCFILYKYFGGRNVSRIEREMRGLGHAGFNRRILYSRTESGVHKPGWIERFGWSEQLAVGSRRSADLSDGDRCEASVSSVRSVSSVVPSSLTTEHTENTEHTEQETDPADRQLPTAHRRLSPDFRAWLKAVSPGMTWHWRHQLHIMEQLERVTSGECKRLMIFMPPRHGKSELVTVRYTAWRMQQDPSMNIILGSYNQRLADRFSRKVRRVIADAEQLRTAECGVRNEEGSPNSVSSVSSVVPKRKTTDNTECTENTEQETDPQSAVRTPQSKMFPFASSRPKNTVSEWETALGGGFRSVGVGGGVTGFGAQLIVIDDPVKSRAEAESEKFRERVYDWFNDDIYTRLEPDGAMILIQTRWHEDDLAGRLLREMHEGGEQWTVIDLPALSVPPAVAGGDLSVPTASAVGRTSPAVDSNEVDLVADALPPAYAGGSDWRSPGEALCPERFDLEHLEKIRRKLGTYSFSALYQQRPTPSDGGTFKREWFRRIVDFAPAGLKWKRGYDLAVSTRTSADFTASFRCAFDAQGNLYIAGGYRARIEFPDQRRFIIERILNEPDTEHGVEEALHGKGLLQDLRRDPRLRGHKLRGVKVETDKLSRALTWAPLAEEGKVILVRNAPTQPHRSVPPASAGGMPPEARATRSGGREPSRVHSLRSTSDSGKMRPTAYAVGSDLTGWISNFIEEASAFPHGQHDDQIDAVSLTIQMFNQPKYRSHGF